MTSTGIPVELRSELRAILRERAGEWLSRFYRHELLVARTVRGAQIEAAEEFERTVVRPLLKAIGGTLSTFSPRGSDLIPESFPEIAALQREIADVVQRGSTAVRKLTEQRMRDIGNNEARWTMESAGRVGGDDFGSVSPPVDRAILQRPWLGDSTERWFEKMLQAPTADSVRAWINTGIQRGLTTDEIVRGLRGTKDQIGILADKPKYQVNALVRTASTHAVTVARAESYKALGVTHYRFVATLDEKTSIQCASQDGKVYEIGKGPVPPLHPNCRSATTPVLDPREDPEGLRASVDGPVPADVAFPTWLERQGVDVQNEVLGKAKANAWRSGKLSLRSMLGADLEPLTLAELREMDRL